MKLFVTDKEYWKIREKAFELEKKFCLEDKVYDGMTEADKEMADWLDSFLNIKINRDGVPLELTIVNNIPDSGRFSH